MAGIGCNMQGQVVILLYSISYFVVFCVEFTVINGSKGVSPKVAVNPVHTAFQYTCEASVTDVVCFNSIHAHHLCIFICAPAVGHIARS